MSDPEIDAMTAVAGALGDLDSGARQRVLNWAAERFDVPTADSRPRGASGREGDGETLGGGDQPDPPQFEHLAELFAATSPTGEADRAIVTAYWLQTLQGSDTWQASDLQREVGGLGLKISRAARAIGAHTDANPPRALCLKKSGTSKQSRFTYKLTPDGVKYVQAMLTSSVED